MISGDYKLKGEYHLKLKDNWPYLPVYLEKMRIINKIIANFKDKKILDAGCGEGALVNQLKAKGFDIVGMDFNYSSKDVKKGDIRKMPFKSEEFDVVLCLDVLEHLDIKDHKKAIDELVRVTKKQGIIIFGLPNLAHFASRLSFLFTGNLIRTSEIERHLGDRPINEFLKLMKQRKLKIIKRVGLFPTFPIISILTVKKPKKAILLHRIYNLLFAYPPWCFENIIITKKV